MTLHAFDLDDRWTALAAGLPLPGLGHLPVNAFLARGDEPLLVDTGCAPWRDGLIAALEARIDLADLRWIWVSHADADHTGNLAELLARAPKARVLASFLALGKLGLAGLPMDRGEVLEHGAIRRIGDLELEIRRPPVFDAPETLGFIERRSGASYAVDAFGSLLPAPAERSSEVEATTLDSGITTWAGIDLPWLALADAARLDAEIRDWAARGEGRILGSHLPADCRWDGRFAEAIQAARAVAQGAPALRASA